MIKHFDHEILYNPVRNCCNGKLCFVMYGSDLDKLKKRIRRRQLDLNATSSIPLTKVVQWTSQQDTWDHPPTAIQIQEAEAKGPVFDSAKQRWKWWMGFPVMYLQDSLFCKSGQVLQ